MKVFDVLNLGAGWQSSRLFLQSCRGELPRLDAAILADTRWEPKAVYRHLEWLKGRAAESGIPLIVASKGDLRADAIEFRENRASSDGKRFASIPVFVKNRDGSQGRVRRQCTKEYKIEVVDRWIRRELLGVRPGGRIPGDVIVRQWFGISDDEYGRATFPGVYRSAVRSILADVNGRSFKLKVKRRTWSPKRSFDFVYPLLNETRTSDRLILGEHFYDSPQSRVQCGEWLVREYPDRKVPRSACVGCPFHSNEEWRRMKEESPEEFEDACQFDDEMRNAGRRNDGRRKIIVGELYLHRQLIPLRDVALEGYDIADVTKGGCGTAGDGQDGMCDV